MSETIKLSEAEIREVYEKTVDYIESKMIESTENCYDLDVTKDQINTVIKRQIFLRLLRRNISVLRMNQEDVQRHIKYNLDKVDELIENE